MKKFLSLLLVVVCTIILCISSVSMAASRVDIGKVYEFIQREGLILDMGDTNINVKFYRICEPTPSGSELRLYVIFISVSDGEKLYPVKLSIVHEIWKGLPDGNTEITQRIIEDDLDGNVDRGAASVQIQTSDSEILKYTSIKLPKEEAQDILDRAISLFLNRYSLRGTAV